MSLDQNDMERLMGEAIYKMWLTELEARDHLGRPDWPKRRMAAAEICKSAGIADAIRAISLDGHLRPPPKWPAVDCVPIGGGPGVITCEVRTQHPSAGLVTVPIALKRKGKEFDNQQIGEAIERGTWEIRKLVKE